VQTALALVETGLFADQLPGLSQSPLPCIFWFVRVPSNHPNGVDCTSKVGNGEEGDDGLAEVGLDDSLARAVDVGGGVVAGEKRALRSLHLHPVLLFLEKIS
jgi:hypothetical protein